jgi:hypothetical protein
MILNPNIPATHPRRAGPAGSQDPGWRLRGCRRRNSAGPAFIITPISRHRDAPLLVIGSCVPAAVAPGGRHSWWDGGSLRIASATVCHEP